MRENNSKPPATRSGAGYSFVDERVAPIAGIVPDPERPWIMMLGRMPISRHVTKRAAKDAINRRRRGAAGELHPANEIRQAPTCRTKSNEPTEQTSRAPS